MHIAPALVSWWVAHGGLGQGLGFRRRGQGFEGVVSGGGGRESCVGGDDVVGGGWVMIDRLESHRPRAFNCFNSTAAATNRTLRWKPDVERFGAYEDAAGGGFMDLVVTPIPVYGALWGGVWRWGWLVG